MTVNVLRADVISPKTCLNIVLLQTLGTLLILIIAIHYFNISLVFTINFNNPVFVVDDATLWHSWIFKFLSWNHFFTFINYLNHRYMSKLWKAFFPIVKSDFRQINTIGGRGTDKQVNTKIFWYSLFFMLLSEYLIF